jgi:membrane-associated phospholipid phosphatase
VSGGQQASARSESTRARAWVRSLVPRGWGHLLFQIALLGSFEIVYALSGIYGRRVNGTALANAQGLLRLESSLGIDWEHGIQNWALSAPHVFLDIANRTYFISQFTISTVFLLWVYARRQEHFARVRNALLAANYVSIVVLFLYPLAPPRAIPGAGFVATLDANAVNLHSSLITALNNPNSAMPSLHASYAIVLGITGFLVTKNIVVRVLWTLYPLLVSYSVIATGNHYVLDVVAGGAALAAAPIVDRTAAWLATRQTGRAGWLAVERETT